MGCVPDSHLACALGVCFGGVQASALNVCPHRALYVCTQPLQHECVGHTVRSFGRVCFCGSVLCVSRSYQSCLFWAGWWYCWIWCFLAGCLVSFAVRLFPESSHCLQGCWGLFVAQYGLLTLAGPLTAPQPQGSVTQTLSLISPFQECLYKGCLYCKWGAGSCCEMGDYLML